MRIKRIFTANDNHTNSRLDILSVVRVGSWLIIFFLLFAFPLFSQSEFSFRLAPAFEAPIGLEQLSPGVGAKLSLDWAFFTFAKSFDVGVSAGGAFASLPVKVGDPLTLLEGSAGAFLRWRAHDRWAFRIAANAGAYQYSRAGDGSTAALVSFSTGADFRLSPYFSLFAQGGFTHRVFSSQPLPSISASLGLSINLSEIMGGRARVQVEKTRQHRVYPVSWAWYEHNPVATVTVSNDEPNAITDLNLAFFMDSFMSEPWTFASVPQLAAGESIEVPVTALFNEALLNLSETVTANGILQIQYRSLGTRKETVSPIQMPIFRRNILSWDDDRRAAAFVSPRDSSARLFARYVAAAVESGNMERQSGTPGNVFYAAALFEALRLYRISYVVDPSSSYTALSDDESAVDSLNYPYETLYYRGGDCDDLSILFCSLLEALGIESAFITVPGHIYTAFEVGDDGLNSDDIIEIDGKRWLPVEVTVPGRGFTQAWRLGARQWRNAGEDAVLFPIRDCWETYPSVTVPASGDNPPQMPEWRQIIDAAAREAGNFTISN